MVRLKVVTILTFIDSEVKFKICFEIIFYYLINVVDFLSFKNV